MSDMIFCLDRQTVFWICIMASMILSAKPISALVIWIYEKKNPPYKPKFQHFNALSGMLEAMKYDDKTVKT